MKHLKFLFLAVVAVLGFAACTPGEFEAKQYVYFWVQNGGEEAVWVKANTQEGVIKQYCEAGEFVMIDFCDGKKVEGQAWNEFAAQNYPVAKADRFLKVKGHKVANANDAEAWVLGSVVDAGRFGHGDEGTTDVVLVVNKK